MNIFGIGKNGMMNKMELKLKLLMVVDSTHSIYSRGFILWNKRNEFYKGFSFLFHSKNGIYGTVLEWYSLWLVNIL